MIASQKVMTTDTMAHIASIGVGGSIPPPIVAWVSPATTVPMMNVDTISTSPFIGCACRAANAGLPPQVTTVTICIGIKQRRKKATHPVNVAKLKRETKPNEIAMINAVAMIPSQGCLRPDMSRPPCALARAIPAPPAFRSRSTETLLGPPPETGEPYAISRRFARQPGPEAQRQARRAELRRRPSPVGSFG